MEMETILDKVEEKWLAKTIGTHSPSEEASWSTPQI